MGLDQRWNLGMQQQIAGRISVELNYVGTRGSNQQQAEPINIPAPGPGNIQARRPYPRFGNLNINSQALSSEYHALQAKLQKRVSNGVWYLASYTYSRSLTTAPAPGIGGNFTYDTAPSAFDIPHLLTVSFGAELPFGRGKHFLSGAGPVTNAFVGGWQLQSIVNTAAVCRTPTVRATSPTRCCQSASQSHRFRRGRQPDARCVVRQSAFVEPAAFTWQLRPKHSPHRSPVECHASFKRFAGSG